MQAEATLVSTTDRRGRPLRTVACAVCGLFRTDPLPSGDDLRDFHQQDYREEYKGFRLPKRKNTLRSGRLALERLRMLAPLAPAARVLDVGSGSGEWLFLLQSLGHAVNGIEADTAYGEYARVTYGVPVLSTGLFEADLPPSSFEFITAFHVLEHLTDPAGALRRLLGWLVPGGRLLVEVPNINSPHQNPSGRFHYAHVLGFTSESLAYAATLAGFQIESSSIDRFGRNLSISLRRPLPVELPPVRAVAPPPALSRPLITSPVTIAQYYLRPSTYLRWALRMVQFGGELGALVAGANARDTIRSFSRLSAPL
ncbi:MAG: class I SAM-dependent methyltransferase [Acidobacteria bacterium]|nr:class I SAM-dependent methyltransferase [Acidobacteriota bacterium]